MNDTSATPQNPGLLRADRRAVNAISWLSALGALLTTAALCFAIAQTLTSEMITVPGVTAALTDPLPAIEVLSGGPTTTTPSTVDVTVHEAPASVRLALAASAVTGALAPLGVTITIFLIGRQIARLRIRKAAGYAAAALAVTTFASALFTPFLRAIAGFEALRLGPLGDAAPFGFALPAESLALPTVLLLMGALLLVSERWQKDTEGLV